ncbi:hypothetical protein FRX31_002301 [Thalictrum thalictroides]|uniref:F-box domain-containing protein n=1 Tax=Thalictrum thalictroides TaxID=46969 RepID=A0A7J6XF09_THATH|nr:hypothetical protein FRX31_002301 [Thalictrum thalictroides]
MDIVEPCMSWVPIFWGRVCRLFTQTRAVDLPYDIILDILSRLPAKLVFQCRDFCRTLSELTSSPSLINMHLNRATSVIVTQWDCYLLKMVYMKVPFLCILLMKRLKR